MPETLSVKHVEITGDNAGQRLDNFLMSQLKGAPRALIYRIVRKGEVRVNKKRCKPEQRLQVGDDVRIPPIRLGVNQAQPTDPEKFRWLEQSVLFEDDALLIVNKPSGVAVHGGSEISAGIIEGFRLIRPQAGFLELAHRLDRQTSGCLILAKTRPVLLYLQEQLRAAEGRHPHKVYQALLHGNLHASRRVEFALDKVRAGDKDRRTIVDPDGKPSLSLFEPLENFADAATLAGITLITGRNHQARAHAAAIGHPIAGDEKYGKREFNRYMKTEYRLNRLFLHAWRVEFIHPHSLRPIKIEAPLPAELSAVLDKLRA